MGDGKGFKFGVGNNPGAATFGAALSLVEPGKAGSAKCGHGGTLRRCPALGNRRWHGVFQSRLALSVCISGGALIGRAVPGSGTVASGAAALCGNSPRKWVKSTL